MIRGTDFLLFGYSLIGLSPIFLAFSIPDFITFLKFSLEPAL